MTKNNLNISVSNNDTIQKITADQIEEFVTSNKRLDNLYNRRKTQDSLMGVGSKTYDEDRNVDNPWNVPETKKQIAKLENDHKNMWGDIELSVSRLADIVHNSNMARAKSGNKTLMAYSNMGAIECREMWFSKKVLKSISVNENNHKYLIVTQRPAGGHDVQSFKAQWECIVHDAKYWMDLSEM